MLGIPVIAYILCKVTTFCMPGSLKLLSYKDYIPEMFWKSAAKENFVFDRTVHEENYKVHVWIICD